ncbi:hypothetical protein [Brevibacillus sp. SIMBA_076]|uniref:hypothetical protein n=1 Tax=Brevibacillus sp. SIMBA_076 TaxID=3085814 RepID=UPI00397D2198
MLSRWEPLLFAFCFLIAEANRVIDKSIEIIGMVQEGIGSKELFTANVSLFGPDNNMIK